MRQTKFITLLNTLSKKEFNDFEKYLLSFYSKRNRDLFVFKYIYKYKNNLGSSHLDISTALKNCFELENITKENLTSNILPKLYNFLEEFLIWQEFKTKKYSFQKEKVLLNILKKRELDDFFEKKLQALEKKLDKENKNMWSYLSLFELSYINYFSLSNDNKSIKNDIMLPVFENLNGTYITSVLKLACEQKFRERVVPGKKIEITFLSQIQDLAKQRNIYNNNKLIQIYLTLLELIEISDDNKYRKFKDLLRDNYVHEKKEDQPLLYGFLMNYIASEIKKGNKEYIKEAKDWVTFGLESKLFIEEGYIPSIIFNNLIHICCGTENIELAQKIIHEYAHTLKLRYREETLTVSQASIDWMNKDFDAIIEKVNPQKINHRIINLQARLILLRALGEKRDWEAFGNFIEASYNSFYRTNYLGASNKQSALNTLKYAEKLMNPNTNVKKFIEEVEKLEFLFCKSWLLKQIQTKRF